MSLYDRLMNRAIVKRIAGDKFQSRNPNEYLYPSLTQPPVKVLQHNGTDNELEWTVECPNCHQPAVYGTHLFMISGECYCAAPGCRQKLVEKQRKEAKCHNTQQED